MSMFDVSAYVPSELTEEQIGEHYGLYQQIYSEGSIMSPDSYDAYRRDHLHCHKTSRKFSFEARKDGALIGLSTVSVTNPEMPAPQAERVKSWVDIDVHEDYRRNGIGTALLRNSLDVISDFGIEKVFAGLCTETGKAFCEQLGGSVADRCVLSFFDIKTADWQTITGLQEKISTRNSDYSVEITHGLRQEDEADYKRLFHVFAEEISQYSGEWDYDHDYFESELTINLERMKETREVSILAYARNNGNAVGMSELRYDPKRPIELYTEITGVMPDHRKRGLSKWMKAKLFQFVSEYMPEINYIKTDNDEDNNVMRDTNELFGFKNMLRKLPAWMGFVFDYDKLRERVRD